MRASITDITDRQHAQVIMAGERDVFERIAADAPLGEILAATVALAESISPDYVVCIGRLGHDGKSFAEVIGARLPPALRAAEENTVIDVRNGSSAAAVYLGRAVLVGNVRTDPYWQRRRADGRRGRLTARPGRCPSRPPAAGYSVPCRSIAPSPASRKSANWS